eukprot:1983091-Amphidinium_carterae.1
MGGDLQASRLTVQSSKVLDEWDAAVPVREGVRDDKVHKAARLRSIVQDTIVSLLKSIAVSRWLVQDVQANET